MKNFGGSLNPLGHVGNAFNAFGGTFKGFGRPAASTPSPPQSIQGNKKENARPINAISSMPERSPNTELDPKIAIFMDNPEAIATKIKTFSPPLHRFVEAKDASELQIKDISLLLSDYQRLAGLLNELANVDAETPQGTKT